MPRRAELLRHAGALVFAVLGMIGVFGLSMGMNAQVERKALEVVSVLEGPTVAAAPKAQQNTRKKRASPTKKARKSAPSPAPLLAAGLGGLDFGLDGAADVAMAEATEALIGAMGGAILDEETVDVPPTASTRTPPSYPARARAQGQAGAVTLIFVVDIDGSVQDLHVLEATPPGVFDQAALEAVADWRFEPGQDDGSPVAVRVRQTLHFELE